MSYNLLNPLQLNLRQGNLNGLQFYLDRVLKKTLEPNCLPRLKTEIYLEVVKTYRALDRHAEAVQLCDLSIANIPPECFDLLSALKRLRSLLYLDAGDLLSARNLIEETDGLELILQGGQSIVNRSDIDVTVETWLVSTEISLAQRDLISAQLFFDKALTRLSNEEMALRRKRIPPMERKKVEQYYHDLSQILNLYGLTLSLLSGDIQAENHLGELLDTVAQENEVAMSQRKLPNVPLYSKLICLLGIWTVGSKTPHGIPLAEARRWAGFGNNNFIQMGEISPVGQEFENAGSVTGQSMSSALVSLPSSGFSAAPEGFPSISEQALDMSAHALEKMAAAFAKIENILPHFERYLKGTPDVDYTQRGWKGHLLDTDLNSFLHNIMQLRWTGCVTLSWKENLYDGAIMKGYLPELLRCGEAYLYAAEGFIIDCVFKGQTGVQTVEKAQENFMLVTRMCFSLHVDDTRPDILGKAVPSDDVLERAPLIRIRDNDLIFIVSDLEAAIEGVEKDDGESGFFDNPTPVNHNSSTLIEEEKGFEIQNNNPAAFTNNHSDTKSEPVLDDNFSLDVEEKPDSLDLPALDDDDDLLNFD